MNDKNAQLLRQAEQQINITRQEDQVFQQQTVQKDQFATQETQNTKAVNMTVSQNKYLQNQNDAEAPQPDENMQEIMEKQSTIGLGKSMGISAAVEKARNGML